MTKKSVRNESKSFKQKRGGKVHLFHRDLIVSSIPLPQTALHLAVITEQPEVVAHLMRAGCDPQLVDNSGNTALHIACRTGSVTCFSVLTQACTSTQLTAMLSTLNYSGKEPPPPPPPPPLLLPPPPPFGALIHLWSLESPFSSRTGPPHSCPRISQNLMTYFCVCVCVLFFRSKLFTPGFHLWLPIAGRETCGAWG